MIYKQIQSWKTDSRVNLEIYVEQTLHILSQTQQGIT